MVKIMNVGLISLSIVLMAFSFAVADVHPGLKNAIDKGDYKMAKNLVEKVGVKDIYCPATLKVKDAEKIYAQLLTENPKVFLRGSANDFVSPEFGNEYLKVNCNGKQGYKQGYNYQICVDLYYSGAVKGLLKPDSLLRQWLHNKDGICLSKETIESCRYFYNKTDDESLKMEVLRVADQKNLLKYSETVEDVSDSCFDKKIKISDKGKCFRDAKRHYRDALAECNKRQRHIDLCMSSAVKSYNAEEKSCEYGYSIRECSSKKVKKKVVKEPFLYEVYELYRKGFEEWQKMDDVWGKNVSLLSKYIDGDDVVNKIIKEYKDKGDLDIRQLVGNCKLTPNFDKKVQKKIGFELFSCKDILVKYPVACDERKDSTKSFGTTLNGANPQMYTCVEGKWNYTKIGEKCGERNKGVALGTYACDSVWKFVFDVHLACDESIDSVKIFESIVKEESPILLACDGYWRKLNKFENEMGVCNNSKKGNTVGVYICDSVWNIIPQLELPVQSCENDSVIQSKYNQEMNYKCDNGNWIVVIKDNKVMMVDHRDGTPYKITSIGKKTWMAENLNYEYNEDTATSYCYKDSSDNCVKYGRLYTWPAAMKSCPNGWRLPTKEEFDTLITVTGKGNSGIALKSTSGWNDGGNGADKFGFSALPVGIRGGDKTYSGEGNFTNFWSSTEFRNYGSDGAYFMILRYDNTYASLYDYGLKYAGLSVRCVQD